MFADYSEPVRQVGEKYEGYLSLPAAACCSLDKCMCTNEKNYLVLVWKWLMICLINILCGTVADAVNVGTNDLSVDGCHLLLWRLELEENC